MELQIHLRVPVPNLRGLAPYRRPRLVGRMLIATQQHPSAHGLLIVQIQPKGRGSQYRPASHRNGVGQRIELNLNFNRPLRRSHRLYCLRRCRCRGAQRPAHQGQHSPTHHRLPKRHPDDANCPARFQVAVHGFATTVELPNSIHGVRQSAAPSEVGKSSLVLHQRPRPAASSPASGPQT